MLNLKTKVDLIYFTVKKKMEKTFDFLNKIFNFTVSKIPSFLNIQTFCIKNQPKIFGILCIIYVSFLCCTTTPVIAAIIFFWSGFLFTVVYMLNVIKSTCISNGVRSSFFLSIDSYNKNWKFKIIFVYWGYFYLCFFVLSFWK